MDEAATASLRYVSLRTLIKKGTVPIKREYGSEFCEKPFGAYSHDVERRRDYEKQEIKLRNVVEKCAQGKIISHPLPSSKLTQLHERTR